ncbi:UNVERIFIED_CONTAM: U2 small nuclear ribonucleoprotein B'' [Sesamum angustifolium]|uniref:U2 small nuclear ribonucleoprotein B n=1 Tax=Sesamum angustifolium TaxID=2727405 RepID=A0AAW2QSX4_9LAMI
MPARRTTDIKHYLASNLLEYGRIVDIVALKTSKLRGQAWVVFSEVTAASNAVRQMQNFPFYDKPMSDCIAKAEGTYDKKKKQEEKAERRDVLKKVSKMPQQMAPGPTLMEASCRAASRKPGHKETAAEPNNILFIQNLPYETNSMMLELLFKQYPGFRSPDGGSKARYCFCRI